MPGGGAYLSFDGRVAIVTGAGSGLGRSYAVELARRGARVVVNDYGGVSTGNAAGRAGGVGKAQAVVDEIVAAGGTAVADAGSVADYDAVRGMVARTVERFGRLDAVIVNAGVYRDRRIERLQEQDYDITMGVHVKGAFNVVRHAWPVMAAQKYGRIVLTSSGSAFGGQRNYWLYGTAKSAMFGMVNNLRYEGRALNIKVNALLPGAATAMSTSSPFTTDEQRAAMLKRAPPELVTPAAVYLCHEACEDSGECIEATSGYFGRASMVRGPRMRPAKEGGRVPPQSVEWVRDHWDAIMGLNAKGEKELTPQWTEASLSAGKGGAMGVPLGRRPRPERKARL